MLKIQIWKENEILRKVSDKIKISEFKKYVKLWEKMIKHIKNSEHGWVWLAAPQIWENKRLIVVSLLKDRDDEEFTTLMMINPEITNHSDNIEKDIEWCLSLPWEKWKVSRFFQIKLNFIWKDLKEKILILEWLSARIIQHEIDHLDWILFTDRIKESKILVK